LSDLKATQERYQHRLLSLANVTGVGIGTKVVDGKDTGELCIKVFVSQKLPLEALNTEDRIPELLAMSNEEIKTDVEVAGPFFALWGPGDHQKRIRPVLGGISTSRTAPGTGTICGYYFRDKRDGKVVGLSNNHVWAAAYDKDGVLPNVPLGLTHIQPGVADAGTEDEMFHVGRLKRYVTIKATQTLQGGAPPQNRWNRVDMALSDPIVPYEQTVLGLNNGRIQPKGYRRVDISDVQKKTAGIHSGRSTNISYGHVVTVNNSFWVSYGSGLYVFFTDCVVWAKDPPSDYFIKPGDSGSTVFIKATNEWAGLIFAGDNYSNGITCQPDNVLKEGEIDFYIGPGDGQPPKKYGPASTSIKYEVTAPTSEAEPSEISGVLSADEYPEGSTVRYSGVLKGKNDGLPLANRNISWVDSVITGIIRNRTNMFMASVTTDQDGRFEIQYPASPQGKHELIISFAGDP
jgi:hypothetical protein